jgi:hypothetical protein
VGRFIAVTDPSLQGKTVPLHKSLSLSFYLIPEIPSGQTVNATGCGTCQNT